jgi:catechol 2,3-dioxygenase-like lactoylglutathione lyase family enzyme
MALDPQAVTDVDFVCIPTTDHDRAVAFYGGTLGLEKGKRWGEMPATEFQAGPVTLAVFDPSGFGEGEARPNTAPIALQVADVAKVREALEAAGVEFAVETIDSGVCHMAPFHDPDGNPLLLHHRYAPKPEAG